MLYEKAQLCWLTAFAPEFVFFLFKVGEAMLEPSVRLYIYESACVERLGENSSACAHLSRFAPWEMTVQEDAVRDLLLYRILLNVPAIALSLFCGAWSDKVGRKLPVMVACLGTLVAVLSFMLSEASGVRHFLPYILVGAFIRGATGKSAMVTMALHSYVADVSSSDERTSRLGRLLSMNFFGYFVGTLAVGTLLSVAGFNEVFSVVAVVYFLCVVVAMTCMRESVEPPDGTAGPPFMPSNVCESVAVLTRRRSNGGRKLLLIMFAVIIFHQACKSGEVDVTMLIVQRQPLSWSQSMYAYLLAADYACLGVAVLILLPLFIRIAQPHDITLVLTGIVFKVLRLALLAIGGSTLTIFTSVVVGCPSAMIISGLKSLISKAVDDDEMGKTFSLLSCGETLASMVGGVALMGIYAATLEVFPGFAFTLEIVLFIGLFGVLLLVGQDMRSRWRDDLMADVARTRNEYGALNDSTGLDQHEPETEESKNPNLDDGVGTMTTEPETSPIGH